MSASAKALVRNPGGSNTEATVVVEQRPLRVPAGVLASFAVFQAWVAKNSPLVGFPTAGEQAHYTAELGLVGITMGA